MDPNGNVEVSGEVRNNWDMDVYEVQVLAIFYDKYGEVKITKKSSPIDKLVPGESKAFKISSGYPKATIDSYNLEPSSPTIPSTTPPPTTIAPKNDLEIISQSEETTLAQKLAIKGEIKNIGTKDLFNVQVSATFYDQYGKEIDWKKSKPITKLSPGETRSFTLESELLRTKIADYKLETLSD
ncbi:MAG: FxLYD domain-containing protein [Candidatus Hydrothermarchaeales archaeon]